MVKLTWCGPLTTPGVLNLTPEFLQCGYWSKRANYCFDNNKRMDWPTKVLIPFLKFLDVVG